MSAGLGAAASEGPRAEKSNGTGAARAVLPSSAAPTSVPRTARRTRERRTRHPPEHGGERLAQDSAQCTRGGPGAQGPSQRRDFAAWRGKRVRSRLPGFAKGSNASCHEPRGRSWPPDRPRVSFAIELKRRHHCSVSSRKPPPRSWLLRSEFCFRLSRPIRSQALRLAADADEVVELGCAQGAVPVRSPMGPPRNTPRPAGETQPGAVIGRVASQRVSTVTRAYWTWPRVSSRAK